MIAPIRVNAITARRWFEKTNGNTYHTVELVLDNGITIKSPRAYGYGEHWTMTAKETMERHGVTFPGIGALMGMAEVLDVKRKKDL